VARILVGVVAGLVAGRAMTYGPALMVGSSLGAALAGPAVMAAAGGIAALVASDPLAAWRQSWLGERERWQRRPPWGLLVVAAGAAAIVGLVIARTVFTDGAGLEAGYATVWADWSQHLTTQASFAIAGNVPPTNPLLSGTPLLYPFLADFQSATLVVLGASPAAALAVPSGLLLLVVALLVVCLGLRRG